MFIECVLFAGPPDIREDGEMDPQVARRLLVEGATLVLLGNGLTGYLVSGSIFGCKSAIRPDIENSIWPTKYPAPRPNIRPIRYPALTNYKNGSGYRSKGKQGGIRIPRWPDASWSREPHWSY